MDLEHKKHFAQTFKRWAVLFKRKDGDVESDKWLMAEYYDSLRHLSPAGFDMLTKALKEVSIFFPTIAECLEVTRPKRGDYGSPFYCAYHMPNADKAQLFLPRKQAQLATTYDGGRAMQEGNET